MYHRKRAHRLDDLDSPLGIASPIARQFDIVRSRANHNVGTVRQIESDRPQIDRWRSWRREHNPGAAIGSPPEIHRGRPYELGDERVRRPMKYLERGSHLF